jgi:hypothetical protein
MKAKSIKGNSPSAIKIALEQSMAGGFKPTLAIVFLSVKQMEGIRKVWDVPIAGMFSNAEMARATNGSLEMHAFTACSVVLKEK